VRKRGNSMFRIPIQVYGHAAGTGRHTPASRTDWQTVEGFFRERPCNLEGRVSFARRPVNDRANRANTMFRDAGIAAESCAQPPAY
jgi:hypothetical protein